MRRCFKKETVANLRERIKVWCPLGEAHFCDGTPNLSVTKNNHRVKPCEHLVKGICTEPHIYDCGRGDNE